jgi:hypothetical protein
MFKEYFGGVAMVCGAVVALSAVSFGIYAITKPASIAIDNRAFHESQAYNDGMAKDLGNFQMEYIRSNDPNKRDALRAVILDRFAGYDTNRLNPNLRAFLEQLKSGG